MCKGTPFSKGMSDDVQAVRTALEAVVGEENEVAVIMHSYGGFPGSTACKGTSKEDRIQEGKKGGLVRLVYIASFAVEEGTNLAGGNEADESVS